MQTRQPDSGASAPGPRSRGLREAEGCFCGTALSGGPPEVPWTLQLEVWGSTAAPGEEAANGLVAWWPLAPGRLVSVAQDACWEAPETEWWTTEAGPRCGAWCAEFGFHPGHHAETRVDLSAAMRLAHKDTRARNRPDWRSCEAGDQGRGGGIREPLLGPGEGGWRA